MTPLQTIAGCFAAGVLSGAFVVFAVLMDTRDHKEPKPPQPEIEMDNLLFRPGPEEPLVNFFIL